MCSEKQVLNWNFPTTPNNKPLSEEEPNNNTRSSQSFDSNNRESLIQEAKHEIHQLKHERDQLKRRIQTLEAKNAKQLLKLVNDYKKLVRSYEQSAQPIKLEINHACCSAEKAEEDKEKEMDQHLKQWSDTTGLLVSGAAIAFILSILH